MPDAPRPSPALMRKTRAVVPPSPPAAAAPPVRFVTDQTVPRRGDPSSVVWPDTSVILSLHAPPAPPDSQEDFDLPARFRQHYRKRMRLAPRVASEIRSKANGGGSSTRAMRVASAASLAYTRLLLGADAMTTVLLTDADLTAVETVKAQLKALPGADPDKKHQGEAECIVLAKKAAGGDQRRHILLANDNGATVIAATHGIPSRHSADVLAEMACADPDLDPAVCMRRFKAGDAVAGLSPAVAPTDKSAFQCVRDADGACALCD